MEKTLDASEQSDHTSKMDHSTRALKQNIGTYVVPPQESSSCTFHVAQWLANKQKYL